LQEAARELVGELIVPCFTAEESIRVHLDSKGFSGWADYASNQITDERAAFTLLHLLSHLNGTAFCTMYAVSCLNPAIFSSLIRYHQRNKSIYRFYTAEYIVQTSIHTTPCSLFLLPRVEKSGKSEGRCTGNECIRTRRFELRHWAHVSEGALPGSTGPTPTHSRNSGDGTSCSPPLGRSLVSWNVAGLCEEDREKRIREN
jgi:hypothetical protein